jgi:hypothetical protein
MKKIPVTGNHFKPDSFRLIALPEVVIELCLQPSGHQLSDSGVRISNPNGKVL